ncbi:Histone acetyltransferase subunit NuA4, putative [Angomonas deanei]|uniref:Histone acetyltransferase subunit NuA4, putative n=1 Tax=Angomonas deanei TaxID=59799 RepID=A0A7G2CP30_9TRYP|nr:Histone acetyltransferase subunit NuA4, putative [Angomonas deanei]
MSGRVTENYSTASSGLVPNTKTRRTNVGGNHVEEVEVPLSDSTRDTLEALSRERAAMESSLTRLDVRIYDLETEFLKQSVELGGSLFDGFGMERQARHQTGMGIVLKKGASDTTASNDVGGVSTSVAGALSYHSRLHSWSPSERVFTASSRGALSRVEMYRIQEAERGGLPMKKEKKDKELRGGIRTRKGGSHASMEEPMERGKRQRGE